VLVLTAQAVGERVWTADINRVLRVYDANVRWFPPPPSLPPPFP
jgi:hypothetical protein